MGNDFKILFPTGYSVSNILDNGNIDANIFLENGNVYSVTFITPNNIIDLMNLNESGQQEDFFWMTDMVIVRNLSLTCIKDALQYLIESKSLDRFFQKIDTRSNWIPTKKEYELFDIYSSEEILQVR
tara:strand:- start:182 stop:562 length:381 start_codon:yes stop_codon:yes gene_type:complete